MTAPTWLDVALDPLLEAAPALAAAAVEVAESVVDGGLVHVIAPPRRRAHASHLAVEFLHPVVAGRRSVPVVMGPDPGAAGGLVLDLFPSTVGVGGAHVPLGGFVPDDGALGRDVALELVLHVVWEGTHVVLDRLHEAARPSGPFDDAPDHDGSAAAVEELVVERVGRSRRVIATVLAQQSESIERLAAAVAGSRMRGGRVWTFGNGGSAADAAVAARLLAGLDLADPAVTTALANDIGVDDVFSRQVRALVGQDDVVLGLSTSGTSANVVAGLHAAREIGACTAAVIGAAEAPLADVVLTVPSDSVHRIQEAHLAVVTEAGRQASP